MNDLAPGASVAPPGGGPAAGSRGSLSEGGASAAESVHATRPPGRRALRAARNLLFWLLPLLLLYLVGRRMDWALFRAHWIGTHKAWVAAGLLYYPFVMFLGALRWRILLEAFNRRPFTRHFAAKHYWIGMALGQFGPASIGWDLYRVLAAGRMAGAYGANAVALVVEKLAALSACALLVLAVTPFLPATAAASAAGIVRIAAVLLASAVALGAAVSFAGPAGQRLFNPVLRRLLPRSDAAPDAVPVFPRLPASVLGRVFAYSLVGQVAAAVGNQIFFRAAGQPLPLLANLFVLPVLTFVFLLPISFGSIGVREGAYVLLYGMFGVPPEAALMVSFFNLSGIVLNSAIGGAWLAADRQARAPREAAPP